MKQNNECLLDALLGRGVLDLLLNMFLFSFILSQNKILAYTSKLIEWAAEMLSESWGTPNLAIPSDMRAPCMALIGLPPCDKYIIPPVGEWNRQLMNDLREKYNVYVFTPSFGGKIWCRISCHVYNSEEDYYHLRDAVKELMIPLKNLVKMTNGVHIME